MIRKRLWFEGPKLGSFKVGMDKRPNGPLKARGAKIMSESGDRTKELSPGWLPSHGDRLSGVSFLHRPWLLIAGNQGRAPTVFFCSLSPAGVVTGHSI